MHRLNLTIDESLYEKTRAIGFVENKSISQLVRESLQAYLANRESAKKATLLLEAEDEKEVLQILQTNEFTGADDFQKKFDL